MIGWLAAQSGGPLFLLYLAENTWPKIVALYGSSVTSPPQTRLGPFQSADDTPSLSNFHWPSGRWTRFSSYVGL